MVWGGDVLEQPAVAIGVGAGFGVLERREAFGLDRPRRGNAGANLGTSFRGRRQHEIGGTDRGHLDLQIDAVEQRR